MSSSLSIAKAKQKNALADKIQRTGIEMPSCSRCDRQGLSCVVSLNTVRCGECVRSKMKCDVSGPTPNDWEKLKKEEERLEAEEEAAALQEQEAFARRMRLRKMQKSLRTRAAEMLRRGLRTLDELDAAEEAERVATAKITVPTGDFDFPEIPLDPVEAEAFWASLDSGGEKLQASQGS